MIVIPLVLWDLVYAIFTSEAIYINDLDHKLNKESLAFQFNLLFLIYFLSSLLLKAYIRSKKK